MNIYLKQKLKECVLERIDMAVEFSDEEIFDIIDEEMLCLSKQSHIGLREKGILRKEIFNSIRRLDILQELIEDSSITEIMINGPNHIFIEREGALYEWNKAFESREKLEDVIQQIVAASNRIVNEASPIVDARLKDGSRVNIVLYPIAIEGPIITIRKFSKEVMNMNQLLQIGTINQEAADFLKKMVQCRYNIFISGGTGAGKTTFLNVLANYIPQQERIITIEDSAELQISNIKNLVRMEVRNANMEGEHEVTIRDLVKTSLRLRPDRIIIGEVRDAVVIDLLSAYNTGHDGSLSTGHANSSVDMLNRLETLVLMGMTIPLRAVRKQIASAIDLIIHLGRLRDRSRRVLEIVEVLDCIDGEIEINPLFIFQEVGEDENGMIIGELMPTGNKLIQVAKLRKAGMEL